MPYKELCVVDSVESFFKQHGKFAVGLCINKTTRNLKILHSPLKTKLSRAYKQ